MEKISKYAIGCCIFIIILFFSSCATHNLNRVFRKNSEYSIRQYHKCLRRHGNASMLLPEGSFSFIWYYENNHIYVTKIVRSKKYQEWFFDCEKPLDISDFKERCYPECLDSDLFLSSYLDDKTDSIHEISICLDVDELVSKGTECPFVDELRSQILMYGLWPDVSPQIK